MGRRVRDEGELLLASFFAHSHPLTLSLSPKGRGKLIMKFWRNYT